jgi:hypothetical protein
LPWSGGGRGAFGQMAEACGADIWATLKGEISG